MGRKPFVWLYTIKLHKKISRKQLIYQVSNNSELICEILELQIKCDFIKALCPIVWILNIASFKYSNSWNNTKSILPKILITLSLKNVWVPTWESAWRNDLKDPWLCKNSRCNQLWSNFQKNKSYYPWWKTMEASWWWFLVGFL